jgi:hypothetical protein
MAGEQTAGLYMWSKPISLSADLDLLVLDSSPLNSEDYPEPLRRKLAQICLLLSSTVVLNTRGHLSDQTLDELMPCLQEFTSCDLETAPQLVWVLRDFCLEFKTLTPHSYLQQCLE